MTLRGGLHVQQGPRFGDAIAMVRECHPGIVLWVDTAPRDVMADVRSWGGLNVARRYWPHGTEWSVLTSEGPEALATFVFGGWRERFYAVEGLVDYAVGANEYYGSDKPATSQLRLAYDFERSLHFKFRSINVRYAAFSFPPGNIEVDAWAQIMAWCKEDGIDFVGDALCAHSYWRSTGGPTSRDSYDPDNPYLIGRECWYEPWPNITVNGVRTSLPIILGEYGFDHSLSGYPKTGFTKQYTMSDRDAVYAQHLLDGGALLAELAALNRRTYIGWTLFTVGGDDEWVRRGFDATQIYQIENAIKSLPSSHTEYVQPEEVPVYEFEQGFAEYAAEHPEVGEPAGPLEYDAITGDAVQLTTTGRLVWRKDANWIGFALDGEDLPYPPGPTLTVHTMDVSSYQPTDLTALIAETGVSHVIVRLYQPAETPGQDVTRQQIASARANGCSVGAYMWLYAAWDARQQIRDAVALMDECGINPRLLWIDYEPYTDGTKPTGDQLAEAVDECGFMLVEPGIYTGDWCWDLGDGFSGTLLWAAQYRGGTPTLDDFIPFGGWTLETLAGKQYQGSPIDLSVFRPEYAEALPEQPEEPPVEIPDTDWKEAWRIVSAERDAAYDRADAAEATLAAIRIAGGW